MFKAIDLTKNQTIIILDAARQEPARLDELRDAGRANTLVCQNCKQPVLVRAGTVREWHFAHKHRSNCPADSESLELLQARAALYRWLVRKFLDDHVEIELPVPASSLPRPIDCVVHCPAGRIAFWIIDAAIKPTDRGVIVEQLSAFAIRTHWLFNRLPTARSS